MSRRERQIKINQKTIQSAFNLNIYFNPYVCSFSSFFFCNNIKYIWYLLFSSFSDIYKINIYLFSVLDVELIK